MDLVSGQGKEPISESFNVGEPRQYEAKGAQRPPSALLRHAWHAAIGSLCAEAAISLAIFGMVFAALREYSDSMFMSLPITDPDIATPLGWFYAFFSIVMLSFGWIVLALRCQDIWCGNSGRFFGGHCGLAAYAFTLVLISFFVRAYVMTIPCVRGFPHWSWGGFCTCDKREPISMNGSPNYLDVVPQSMKIAYIGDTDLANVRNIYKLIKAENASAVVANGDLDYTGSPSMWHQIYRDILGDLPVHVTVGNHDCHVWQDYQSQVSSAYSASNITECVGNIGVKEVCSHAGVALLLSGAGSTCGGLRSDHTPFIARSLKQFEEQGATWKVCNFHKTNYLLQAASLPSFMLDVDEVGVDNFQECLQHGAMIFTSHKHQYMRTHEIDAMTRETVRVSREVPNGASSSNPIRIGRGRSFVVVNGIGGYSVHGVEPSMLANEWWAASFDGFPDRPTAADALGAFFCEYHVQGDSHLARCYFKDIHGTLVDEFYVRAEE